MVTIKKVMDGISAYIETDMVPQVTGYQKWIMIATASLLMANAESLVSTIKDNSMIKALGVMDEHGNVDIDKVYEAIKPAARRCPATIDIPLVGTFNLDESDIDAIYGRICA